LRKVSLLFTTILLGCALTFPGGRLQVVPRSDQRAVLEELTKNWQNYDVYSDGPVNSTSALVFDPKNDDRRLVGFQYVKVESRRNLQSAVNWIDSYVDFDPRLYRIFDEEGAFYGWVYIALHRPAPRRVDERTLMLPKYMSPLHWGGGEGD